MTRTLELRDILHRLEALAPHFDLSADDVAGLSARGAGALLAELALRAKNSSDGSLTWLLLTGVTACFPTSSEFLSVQRRLRLARPELAHRAFLEAGVLNAAGLVLPNIAIEVVSGAVVADVDFCAKHAHNTGIQRVVRQTMSRWAREQDVIPVAWTDGAESLRRLTPLETERVVDFAASGSASTADAGDPDALPLLIPFRSVVVLLEVPSATLCAPLQALADYSGNEVAVLGYDAIPVVSADTVPPAETDRFVKYLSVVKHSSRVAGISEAATLEFAGFVQTLSAQGLTGPSTVSVSLPVDLPDQQAESTASADEVPLVLVVGSHEPRKNHDAILFAAEMLWREGLRFSLRFIGGGSLWYTRLFDARVSRLARAGRAVEIIRGATDRVLLDSYHRAAFTVFPSLHEGYGLPVAESLALGVPVITTSYGSTAEIAADGGCLTVDPRDDDALLDAMRSLLVDPTLLQQLREQIRRRPTRSWDDYASELWTELVEPLLTEVQR